MTSEAAAYASFAPPESSPTDFPPAVPCPLRLPEPWAALASTGQAPAQPGANAGGARLGRLIPRGWVLAASGVARSEAASTGPVDGSAHLPPLELQGGESRGSSGSNYLYAFPLTEDLHLRDDVPLGGTVGQEEAGGVVVSVTPGRSSSPWTVTSVPG